MPVSLCGKVRVGVGHLCSVEGVKTRRWVLLSPLTPPQCGSPCACPEVREMSEQGEAAAQRAAGSPGPRWTPPYSTCLSLPDTLAPILQTAEDTLITRDSRPEDVKPYRAGRPWSYLTTSLTQGRKTSLLQWVAPGLRDWIS